MKHFQFTLGDLLVATTWIALAVAGYMAFGRESIGKAVLVLLWSTAWASIGAGIGAKFPGKIPWATIGAVVGVGILVCIALSWEGPVVDPFPPLADIVSIEVKEDYVDPDTGVHAGTLLVPAEHYEDIFDALKPARKDRNPAKWQVLGEMTIRTKGGVFKVFLFDLPDRIGAFAAGPTWEERMYYRGGNSDQLKDALRNAQTETP